MKRFTDFLDRIANYKGKRIIIWGGGDHGTRIREVLTCYAGIPIAYTVDSRELPGVFPTKRILKEKKDQTLVVVSPHHMPYIFAIDRLLDSWGYKKNCNYINFIPDEDVDEALETFYFDPLLGYSEKNGFSLKGNQSSNNSFLVLGNCTSLTNGHKKMWVDYFEQEVIKKYEGDYCIINGACAGYSSSQELFKLIRDGLIWKPKSLIILNGVIDATASNSVEDYPYYSKLQYDFYSGIADGTIKNTVGAKGINLGTKFNADRVNKYLTNIKSIKAIATAHRIKPYIFVQPSLYATRTGLGKREKAIFELVCNKQSLVYQEAHDFYKRVGEEIARDKNIYYLTSVFKDKNDCYMDEIHYTEYGNKLLADKISHCVLGSR